VKDVDTQRTFLSEAYSFQEAVRAFGNVIQNIDVAYKGNEILDWPTVLLGTLLQTTAISLLQLLPKGDLGKSSGIIDRRSIASLVRNLVDTHDTLDLLCDVRQPEDEFNLHRDIMGYYLSGRLHAAHGKADASSFFGRMDRTREWYWKRICKALPEEARRKRLKRGQSMFYKTRKERLARCCGEHAAFVGKVLADLSSYVHSAPSSLWMKSLDGAFADDRPTRGVLTVWLRITNFYFARSIDIVVTAVGLEITDPFLKEYVERNRRVFA
jgi:hypothetical protein